MTLHFKDGSNYDFFKYGGKTRVTQDSFLRTKGKYFYEKYSRKFHKEDDAIAFLAANFKEGCSWVRDLDEKPYKDFLAYRDALGYKFQQDLEKYSNANIYEELLLGDKSSWIYIILMNEISNGFFIEELNKKHEDDIIWEHLHNNILTFYPFVIYCFNIDMETKKFLLESFRSFRKSYK